MTIKIKQGLPSCFFFENINENNLSIAPKLLPFSYVIIDRVIAKKLFRSTYY